MSTITVANLLSRASTLLQDPTNVRWTQAEMLDSLNDGQRELVIFKPNAYTKTVATQLVAGTKQSIPTDGIALIEITRNMGTNGTTPGRTIRLIGRGVLDAYNPNWHNDTPSAVVRNYMFNPLSQKQFFVTPPQPSSSQGYVEIVYSASPADATLGGTFTLDDIYLTPLLDYILYRAYAKDSEFAGDGAQAQAYYNQFIAAITGKTSSEGLVNPNATKGETGG